MSVQIKNKKGFTLIELLIVITIIGLLAGIVASTLNNQQKKARDTQRKNALTQIKKAMISAKSDCQSSAYFPRAYDNINNVQEKTHFTDLITNLKALRYISANFTDPVNNTIYYYGFKTSLSADNTNLNVCQSSLTSSPNYAGATHFVLRAKLEMGSNDPEAAASYTKCENVITKITTATWTDTSDAGPASGDGYYYVCSN